MNKSAKSAKIKSVERVNQPNKIDFPIIGIRGIFENEGAIRLIK